MDTNRPKFYAMYKDFNYKEMKSVDVLEYVFNSFMTKKNTIQAKLFKIYNQKSGKYESIVTKEQFAKYLKNELMYYFWSKCEWEFLAVDWPNRDTVSDSNPVKIDVYDQIMPNFQLILDLAWNYIEPKIKK